MKRLIVASNNEHKVKEIKDILQGMDINVISLKEAGIFIDVEEDGKTFMENCYKKAKEIVEYLKSKNEKDFMVIADDSGLEVDYLNGEPGVYSARYAGEHGNSEKNNEKLLEKLKGVPKEKRGANFVCSLALITSLDEEIKVEERAYGIITEKYSGTDGFGYDPLFFVPEFNMTFAEMTSEQKNSISHRGKALKQLIIKLKDIL